ncbi:MAG: hypothetical protein WCV90_04640 [Candidatus Woesearchaeota archaeon]|jgi:hypothetical protein
MRKELVIVTSVVLFLFVLGFIGESNVGFASKQAVSEQKLLPAYDQTKCYDSDNGINLIVKGVTRGPSSLKGPLTSKTDYCLNNATIMEYSCFRNIVINSAKSCSSLGSNSFCLNSKCCRIISNPGVYVLEDCDLIEGYYGKYFLRYDSHDGNLLKFKKYYSSPNKGYLDLNGEDYLWILPFGQEQQVLNSYSYNIQFVNWTADGKLIIRKYTSCNETENLPNAGAEGPMDCVYEQNENYDKFFFNNISVGIIEKGYPHPEKLAECTARGMANEYLSIGNILGITSPYDRVVAIRGLLQSGWVAAYSPGTNSVRFYLSSQSNIQDTDKYCLQYLENNNSYYGFFPHETTHLMTNGFFDDGNYCLFFTEGLAQFVQSKQSFDKNQIEHPEDTYQTLDWYVGGCGLKGYNYGYIINGTQTYQSNYTNYSQGCQLGWPNYDQGECFWYLVYNQYGEEKFQKIMQELDKRRFVSNPNVPKQKYPLFNDILVPILGPTIINLTQERWGIPVS